MPAGRPTKYKPEFCDKIIECGKEGMGKAEMAVEIGIHHSTFLAWQEEHPEFSAAVKEAVRQSQAWWERKGRIATFGGVDGFNATSYIFQMKNRFSEDWRDKHHTELTGKGEGPVQIEDVSPVDKLRSQLDTIASRKAGEPDAG